MRNRIIFVSLIITMSCSSNGQYCSSLFTQQSGQRIDGLESFFQAMTRGLILNRNQVDLFSLYRTRFGDPQTSTEQYNLNSVLDILEQFPHLSKPNFREQILERSERVYHSPEELKQFIRNQLKKSGQMRSNLFQIEANEGFWNRLIPPELANFTQHGLNGVISQELKNLLITTSSTNYIAHTIELYQALNQYRAWLQGREEYTQFYNRLRQVMADLVHVAPYFNVSLTQNLRSDSALSQIESYRRLLDLRDTIAMSLGYEGHYNRLLQDLGVNGPSTLDPSLLRLNPSIGENQLTTQLSRFEAEVLNTPYSLNPSERIRIRPLSTIESPFRSCVGGSDCSTRTYFSKALDPNFIYFTMTNENGYSNGQVTVVLGTAHDENGQSLNIAFIDKIQNVESSLLPAFLDGIRQTVAEHDYLLTLPQDVGDSSGLSNMEDIRSFVNTSLLPLTSNYLSAFSPHPHEYDFPNSYSRAYDQIDVAVVPPLPLLEDSRLSPGETHRSWESFSDLNLHSLIQPILGLAQQKDTESLLEFLNFAQSAYTLERMGTDFSSYWLQVETLFSRATNKAIKKRAFYNLLVLQRRFDLFNIENFSPSLWQEILGELPQWTHSSNELRRNAIESLSSIADEMLKWSTEDLERHFQNPLFSPNNSRGSSGTTALHLFAWEGRSEIVERLLQRVDTNINARENFNRTPLHLASIKGEFSIVRVLLTREALDINATDKNGLSALHHAVINNRMEIVRMLLTRPDLNQNIQDSNGQTAYEIAERFDKLEIIRLFNELI